MRRLREHIIARAICKEYIRTKDSFLIKDLVADIISRGGIARVSMGVNITEYLSNTFTDTGEVKLCYNEDGMMVIVNREAVLNSNKI